MRYIKMLGLLAVAAAALMAFTGTASAALATSPANTPYTGTIKATSTHSELHGAFISVTCTHSAVEGKIESHGIVNKKTVPVSGNISSLSFSGCNYAVTVLKAGSLSAHSAGSGNGTLTSTGAEIKIHTSIGECVFTTNATHIGTLTGGTPAKLDIDSAAIPRTGGSFFCGSSGEWTGNYTVSVPSNITLH